MVVFFDIDGTLVDDATQIIPESTVRAISQLRRNGHIPIVNTGRPYNHIDPRVRNLDFCGLVCGCGMQIQLEGEWLVQVGPTLEQCRMIRDLARRCNMQVLYESEYGELHLDGDYSTHPAIREECYWMEKKGFRIVRLDEDQPRFLKLVTFDGPDCRREEFIQGVAPVYDCIDRGNTMLELVMRGCSKAIGIEKIMDHLGVSPEEALAIGDSTNDLPMFSMAGHTVCMGNGMEELKQKAEFITDTVLNDGIEKALRHYGLI